MQHEIVPRRNAAGDGKLRLVKAVALAEGCRAEDVRLPSGEEAAAVD